MASTIERVKLAFLCFIIFCSLSVGTFPLPFLAEYLNDSGYNNLQVGIAFSSFGIGALVGYIIITLLQVYSPKSFLQASSAKKWVFMSASQLLTAITALVLTFDAHYQSFCAARFFQGLSSAVSWTYALSVANGLARTTLGGCFGKTEAAAFVMAMGLVGECCGPWLGTWLFDQFYDSISLPYAMVASFAGVNAILAGVMSWRDRAAHDFEIMNGTATRDANGPEAIGVDSLRKNGQPANPSTHLLGQQQTDGSTPAGVDREWQRPLDASGKWGPLTFLMKDSSFRHLALLLMTSSIPRSFLVFLLPVFTDESLHTSAEQNAQIFGIACIFLIFGALLAGRFVHRQGQPMPFALIVTLIYCIVASFVFFGNDVYSVGFTYCCFCALMIFANVIVIHQLEKFATSIRARDPTLGDRALNLACLLWTVGFNIGSIVAGFTEDEEEQKVIMIIGCIITFLYACFLFPTYGCPRRGVQAPELIAAQGRPAEIPDGPASRTTSRGSTKAGGNAPGGVRMW